MTPLPGLDRPAVLVGVERRDGHVGVVLALPLHRTVVGPAAAVGVRVAGPSTPVPTTTTASVVAPPSTTAPIVAPATPAATIVAAAATAAAT